MYIHDDFAEAIDPFWHLTQQGNADITRRHGALHLSLQPDAEASTYHNAQISSYVPTQRHFTIQPPVRVKVEAYGSLHPSNMRGTAGFGLWNHSFSPDQRGFSLPQTLWFFFGSKDNNMSLARGVAGNGFKAATMDARRWQAQALLPLAPLAIPLMHVPPLYRVLYPIAQRALGIHELALDGELLQAYHTYEIVWLKTGARFIVDGQVLLETHTAPAGPLGFIAWIDNQFAIVTPQGHFRFGLCPIDRPQALVMEQIQISEP